MSTPILRKILIVIAPAALLVLAACSDKEEEAEPTSRPSPVSTQADRETPKATPTAPATPDQRATPAKASPSPSSTPGDGAIDALNPGSTTPVTVKANPSNFSGTALLKDVRSGAQKLGDRVVFEFEGASLPPAKVEYVDSVSQCGSGQPVQVKGSAILLVTFTQAAAHDDQGKATFDKLSVAGPGPVVQEIVRTCDFEGHVAWAIGVSGKKNFKVTTLTNPTRLVVDVLK
ncbi:MAG: hypothetical protein HUU14_06045 [Dehalococcoidia bacterium]|nr:hypothetical protein [Chloroflexi bacterium CFX7]NUQ55425.1 hypothetical protein [Dehalococcoidia bacterium]RIL03822.1 MAG: hypothetical protein DCC78_03455 [bacterium]